MNERLRFFILVLLLSVGMRGAVQADTIYVATNGTNDVAHRFNTWAGAATNIHDAIAVAVTGDTVLVSNGVYRTTNTIVIATNFALLGVSGPDVTTLWPTGGSYNVTTLGAPGAMVAGFTLRGIGVKARARKKQKKGVDTPFFFWDYDR